MVEFGLQCRHAQKCDVKALDVRMRTLESKAGELKFGTEHQPLDMEAGEMKFALSTILSREYLRLVVPNYFTIQRISQDELEVRNHSHGSNISIGIDTRWKRGERLVVNDLHRLAPPFFLDCLARDANDLREFRPFLRFYVWNIRRSPPLVEVPVEVVRRPVEVPVEVVPQTAGLREPLQIESTSPERRGPAEDFSIPVGAIASYQTHGTQLTGFSWVMVYSLLTIFYGSNVVLLLWLLFQNLRMEQHLALERSIYLISLVLLCLTLSISSGVNAYNWHRYERPEDFVTFCPHVSLTFDYDLRFSSIFLPVLAHFWGRLCVFSNPLQEKNYIESFTGSRPVMAAFMYASAILTCILGALAIHTGFAKRAGKELNFWTYVYGVALQAPVFVISQICNDFGRGGTLHHDDWGVIPDNGATTFAITSYLNNEARMFVSESYNVDFGSQYALSMILVTWQSVGCFVYNGHLWKWFAREILFFGLALGRFFLILAVQRQQQGCYPLQPVEGYETAIVSGVPIQDRVRAMETIFDREEQCSERCKAGCYRIFRSWRMKRFFLFLKAFVTTVYFWWTSGKCVESRRDNVEKMPLDAHALCYGVVGAGVVDVIVNFVALLTRHWDYPLDRAFYVKVLSAGSFLWLKMLVLFFACPDYLKWTTFCFTTVCQIGFHTMSTAYQLKKQGTAFGQQPGDVQEQQPHAVDNDLALQNRSIVGIGFSLVQFAPQILVCIVNLAKVLHAEPLREIGAGTFLIIPSFYLLFFPPLAQETENVVAGALYSGGMATAAVNLSRSKEVAQSLVMWVIVAFPSCMFVGLLNPGFAITRIFLDGISFCLFKLGPRPMCTTLGGFWQPLLVWLSFLPWLGAVLLAVGLGTPMVRCRALDTLTLSPSRAAQ